MDLLVKQLTKRNLTIATCESLTGGQFAATLTSIPGTSVIFKGGLVVYSNEAKIQLAQVSPNTLEAYGANSEQCAKEMAQNTLRLLKVDIALSLTGNAGPQAQENKPIGLVFIGLATPEKSIVESCQFSGSRAEVRQQAIDMGVKLIGDNCLLLNADSSNFSV